MRLKWLGRISLLLAFVGSAAAVRAETPAQFYAGKTILAIAGNPPGGDYDNWVRLLARHWGDFIPGHPSFMVENMPGAGQIVATNYMYSTAAQDGSVVAMTERSLPYLKLMGKPNLRFDPTKFNWIGSPETTNRVCVAMAGAPVQTGEDLFKTQLLVGGAGAGTAVSNTPVLLAKLLGMKLKLVEGYASAEDVMLAMDRGEVQGICQTVAGLNSTRPGWLAEGKFKILFSMEHKPLAQYKAPTIYKFTHTKEQADIIGLYDSSIELGRPVIAPPNVPADRVAALRTAFDEMTRDPGFLADAKRLGYHITLTKGQEIQETVDHIMATPKNIIDAVRTLTQ